MFKRGALYSHVRMLDAAIYVLRAIRLKNGDYRVKVRWMRRDGLDFNQTEEIRIVKKEVRNWYEFGAS